MGRVLSSQGMQHTALQHERDMRLAFWDDAAPRHDFIEFSLRGDGGKRAVHWRAPVPRPGNSVCQRVKIPRWMDEFQRAGGTLHIRPAGTAELDALARDYELVIVAAGKGEIARLFERDDARSPYDMPMRALALTYAVGMERTRPDRGVTFNAAPGVGEYFVMPAITVSGECEIMVFEGLPGGPMDCWGDVDPPRFFLWLFERAPAEAMFGPLGETMTAHCIKDRGTWTATSR